MSSTPEERAARRELNKKLRELGLSGSDNTRKPDGWVSVEKVKQAFMEGYKQGHDVTVESCYGDPEEAADDYIRELPPAPTNQPEGE